MKKSLLFLIALFSPAFCEEKPQVSQHNEVMDKRENYFPTSTPYKILPKVNPITGDLIEEEVDLVVAGSEPLSACRFYNHTAAYEPRTGGWRYNPEVFLFANFEWPGQEKFVAVGEKRGSITPFSPATAGVFAFSSSGFAHFQPSGQTHPLNTKIHYSKIFDPKNQNHFSWCGEITDGSGGKRFFDKSIIPLNIKN